LVKVIDIVKLNVSPPSSDNYLEKIPKFSTRFPPWIIGASSRFEPRRVIVARVEANSRMRRDENAAFLKFLTENASGVGGAVAGTRLSVDPVLL
jgi:hypothetical protein